MYKSKKIEEFVLGVSKYSGISKTALKKAIEEYGLKFVLSGSLCLRKHIPSEKLMKLREMRSLLRIWNELEFVEEVVTIDSSVKAKEYFEIRLKDIKDKERFEVCFLDTQNQIIFTETLFEGTIDESPVYPREVIKMILEYNAKSVILAHNHPGGSTVFSESDKRLTDKLKEAINTIGVRVLDHIVVGSSAVSMSEKGIL